MANNTKKIISVLLSVLMIFSTASVAFGADSNSISVEIISFMRGSQTNLRSSELLEAHVEGYGGNVRELTYKWKSTLGTYVYVYNSHNMYNINNTDGEIEIHNTDKSLKGLSNMVGRTYNKSFTGKGYAWASVYGASIGNSSLQGTLTVEVYDENGKLLCSDSHTGTGSGNKRQGFVYYNLDSDMDNVVLGLFEGDKRNVKDLLGESAVVHITCTESQVDSGKIISGSEHIKLTKESGDYYITGTVAGTSTDSNGDAQVDLDISKGNCKFHNKSSGDAITTVFVFKRPTTDTTATTLTLTGNLDDRCDYFIGGVEGSKQPDGTIIFTGLTPNTSYTVEVRGEYKDNNKNTKYAYAYVYDTTKPIYKATVQTYLDDILTDITDIHGEDVSLYLHEDKDNAEYIPLNYSGTGTYTADVTNGAYYPWHIEAGDHYHKAKQFKLIIENANGHLDLHHYSVTYDTNDGSFSDGSTALKEIYPSASSVTVTNNIPTRDGYIFTGWESDGNIYTAGKEITSRISSPITLTAKWEKAVNVKINVTIDHRVNGGFDSNADKDELTVDFLEKTKDSPAFIETGDRLFFSKKGVTDEKGNKKPFEHSEDINKDNEVLVTRYTATAPTYEGLLESSYFGVALSKSGYEVGTIEKIKDENGNWTINIPLTYNPVDFDLEFSVKMHEDVPQELYPDAVIVKVACWDTDKNEWVIITQQRTTDTTVRPGVRVDIDKTTGEGKGSYPVWKFDSDNNPYGYRAVVTGFIYNNSTVIVPTEKDHTKDDGKVIITYTDGNYTATMGDIADGKKYSTSLNGAYYNEEADRQQGTLDGVITVEKYDVTFDAQGGTVNGKDKDVSLQQYYIPSFDNYKPVMPEHNFLGWYLDKECTSPATQGELLTEDITLYAKWDKLLTGTLTVDGYYTDENGVQHPVDKADRATHALVELEEIFDGHTYDIAGQTVNIEWTDGNHFSNPVPYEFKGLDPDKTYRINVYLVNYEATYQNSTTIINGNGDIHDDYNDKDYVAVYPSTSVLETFVNTFMHFEPEEFPLNVEVDTTRIGEGFRPSDALVKYYSQEVGIPNDYVLIVQHKGENDGVQVGMDTATGKNNGTYGDTVWKKNFNGNLYDYQADLTKLDNKALSEWPVIVSYGDSVRWSPYNQAPTDNLKVNVIPRWYYVNYDWNTIKDENGNKIIESISRGHIWSHETQISYVPECEGYNFLGWYSDAECTGEPVTKIEAAVHNDTTLYAKWEKIPYSYTVNYLEEGTDKVLRDKKEETAYFGDSISESAVSIDKYVPVGDSEAHFVIDEDNKKITFYYTTDELGGENGDESDGIPDKYQKKVIFKVVNGTWENGSKDDIISVVNLMKNGKFDVDGTAELTVPFGMKANEGFKDGLWDVTPPSKVSGTDTAVYTFTFSRSTTPVEPLDTVSYIVEHYKATAKGVYSDVADEVEIESGKIGETVTATPKDYEGFTFDESVSTLTGKLKAISGADDILVLKLYYDVTVTEEPTEPEDPTDPSDPEEPTNPSVPEEPTDPSVPEEPTTPGNPDVPGGSAGNDDIKHHILFGKTDGIGWYHVSQDGGKSFDIVFGNSTYEVPDGTEIIVKVGDIMGDSFVFYVNGEKHRPDENGQLVITVNGYMLIGAISVVPEIDFEVPDVEESLNWFQRIWKAIKDFFRKLFGIE